MAHSEAVNAVDLREQAGLDARDCELLRLLADGLSTAEIAHRLHYSESNVKQIMQRVLEKLEARNRANAVAIAMRSGII